MPANTGAKCILEIIETKKELCNDINYHPTTDSTIIFVGLHKYMLAGDCIPFQFNHYLLLYYICNPFLFLTFIPNKELDKARCKFVNKTPIKEMTFLVSLAIFSL